jgi:hypothetical protein
MVHRGGDSMTSFLNEEFLNEDPLARYRASTMSSRPSSLVTAAASDLITGHASKGYWGHQFLDALERPFHHLFSFSRRPRWAKRSWRLHRVSPCRDQFLDLAGGYSFAPSHAAWDTGLIGLWRG